MSGKILKFVIATPYFIPERVNKVVNVGDGFILEGVKRLVGGTIEGLISTRSKPSPAELDLINSADLLILAGANQLNDNFTIFPGYTVQDLEKIKVPILPVGIGIHGEPKFNQGLSTKTREILIEMHQRIKASSWRCPMTVEYLEKNLPELKGAFRMTGCPVAYDQPIFGSSAFNMNPKRISVTITDRGDFFESESNILKAVRKSYPHQELWLCLHQDNLPAFKSRLTRTPILNFLSQNDPFIKIRQFAHKLGYKILPFSTHTEAFDFYKTCDLHIGSRLHAHLYFLSQAKPSFLYGFDLRHVGISQTYGFEIRKNDDLKLNPAEFIEIRKSISRVYSDMLAFKNINSL